MMAALAGFLSTWGLANAAETPSNLKIFTAVEVEFETETGKLYQLQGSSNLTDWVDIGAPVFGVGKTISQVFSTRGGGEVNYHNYRLHTSEGPTNGFAPWTFAGLTVNFDDQLEGDLVKFITATNGVDLGEAPDDFLYSFTRTSLNEVRLVLNYGAMYYGVPSSNKIDVITMTFTAANIGTWVRDEFRKGQMKDRDMGVFSIVTGTNQPPTGGGTNQPPIVNAPIPTALTGWTYAFQSGEHPDRLVFSTSASGTEFGDDVNDDEPNFFTYTYSLTTSNTASLVVTFKAGKYDQYDITFKNGAQGSFVRKEYDNNLLKDTDRGALSAIVIPPTNGNTNDNGTVTTPPSAPSGFTYTMLSGDIPERLIFTSATAGTQLDDSAPSSFTYTYTVKAANQVQMLVRFKSDKWDEYDLVFTDGRAGVFTRRQFDRNALKDTDQGPFTVAPTQ